MLIYRQIYFRQAKHTKSEQINLADLNASKSYLSCTNLVMTANNYKSSNDRPPKSGAPPVIAAIDLGTNSCRLLVARIEGQSFRVIDSFSRVVRLGEGIQASNFLTDDAIERTIEALKVCKKKIIQNHVKVVRAVTTEACRRAENSDILIQRAQNETGINLEVITTEEEAQLALAGCSGILNTRIPYALAFDIGGGSTEVMWLRINEPRRLHRKRLPVLEVLDYISLPFGVVTLSDYYKSKAQPNNVYHEIRDEISSRLVEFSHKNDIYNRLEKRRIQMVGTSGTVTTLAAINMGLERYDRRLIDGVFLNVCDIRNICKSIFDMSVEERSLHPCIGISRSDLVIMGTAILEGICDTWPVQKLRVADRGVREGILMELLKNTSPQNGTNLRFVKIKT